MEKCYCVLLLALYDSIIFGKKLLRSQNERAIFAKASRSEGIGPPESTYTFSDAADMFFFGLWYLGQNFLLPIFFRKVVV